MFNLNFITIVLSYGVLNYIWFDFLISMYKSKKKNIFTICIYILNTIAMVALNINGDFTQNLIGNIILFHITAFLYFDLEKRIINYAQSTIFLLLFIICEFTVFFSLNIAISVFELVGVNEDVYEIFKRILSLIIMMIIYRYLKKIFNLQRKKSFGNINPILMIVMPIFSIIILHIVFMLERYNKSPYIAFIAIIVTLGIGFINLYLIKINEYLYENNKLKYDLDLINRQANIQLRYYEEIKMKYEENRLLFHDVKRHIEMIKELYQNGDDLIAQGYIDDIYKAIDKQSLIFRSNNKVFEILINEKIKFAKSKDIELNAFSSDPDLQFISDIDIVTIFANIIDNAIEAVSELKENRVINFEVNSHNNMITINIQNKFSHINFENDKFISTKNSGRGLGLTSIKMAIEKYNGLINFKHKNKMFNLTIIIPTPKKEGTII